ncbi:MAG TPA: hypothetical protein VF497_18095 [Rudaea sp.]
MSRIKTLFLASGIGLLLLLTAGCGSKDSAELVGQRAVERWDLLAGKHAVKAYDYLSPGYRSTHTLEQYVAFIATARMQWKSAKVDSVQCESDICTAKLTVVAILPGAVIQRPSDMEYPAPVVEKWVRSDGQWFFLPDSKIDAKNVVDQAASPAAPASTLAPEPAKDAAPPAAAGADPKDGHKQ